MRAPLSKPAARERGKAVRAALNGEQKSELDSRIVASCQEALDWPAFTRIHLFVPIERMKEINTWPMLEWIWKEHPGLEVYVPRVVGRIVEHVRVTPSTQWILSALGIPEPRDGPVLGGHENLDVILVPLLACDGRGHRVGYGGGYYDRFLSEHDEAFRIGLVYADCLIAEGIQAEGHDVPLHQIITG
jgi:5-formyltetrahydrofolate cyclo-ligase